MISSQPNPATRRAKGSLFIWIPPFDPRRTYLQHSTRGHWNIQAIPGQQKPSGDLKRGATFNNTIITLKL